MTDAKSIIFTGQSGIAYEFFAFPLGATLSPVGGVYLLGRLGGSSGEENQALQVLFIGEGDDIADSAARFRQDAELASDRGVLFCMHLEDTNVKKRQTICEDLREHYLPTVER